MLKFASQLSLRGKFLLIAVAGGVGNAGAELQQLAHEVSRAAGELDALAADEEDFAAAASREQAAAARQAIVEQTHSLSALVARCRVAAVTASVAQDPYNTPSQSAAA